MSDLDDQVAALAALNHQIERLTEAKRAVQERIIELAGGYGTYEAAGLKVTVRHNRRLNFDRFKAAFPVEDYPAVYKSVADTAAIKRYIAPADLDPCYDEGAPVVVVGSPE